MRRVLLSFVLASLGCDPSFGAERDTVDAAIALDPDAALVRADGGLAPVNFRREIRPILDRGDGPPAGCKRCHYPTSSAPQGYEIGGLDLSTLGALQKGGVSSGTRIVVAGDPSASILVQKLEGTYSRGARMPKDLTPLSTVEIALIRRWIAEGAAGADDE